MRASLLVVPLLLSCGGGSTSTPTKPDAPAVAVAETGGGKGTRGFDEYPQGYGADEYGDFGYDDGYAEGGYDGGEWGGEEYGGDVGPYVPPPPTPPDLVGTWTGACEPGAKDGKKLAFVFTATRWDVTIEQFADTTCTKRKTTIAIGGPYTFGEQSTTVPGAWNGAFSFDRRDVTADDAKTAKALGKTCGIKKLKAGATVSLLGKGCAKLGFKPLADCAADHDVVAIVGSRVRFGVRPADNDLCTEAKRPTALDQTHTLEYAWPPTGVPECDTYFQSVSKIMNCPGFPADAGFLSQMKQVAHYYVDAASCKMANDAMAQGMASMGC